MEQELGVPWEDVFETVDPQPLAAGTIAQVHRASLATGAARRHQGPAPRRPRADRAGPRAPRGVRGEGREAPRA